MDLQRFPPEIRQMIVSHWAANPMSRSTNYVVRWPLSMFATLARDLQPVIERYTFAAICLHTKDFLSGTAIKYLSHRLGYVKKLLIKLSFADSHGRVPCSCPDCIMVAFFELLKSASHKGSRPYIDLVIELEPCAMQSKSVAGQRVGTSHPKCFLMTMDEKCLPETPAVLSLNISAPLGVLFIPSSACRIASRLTKLASFSFTGIWWTTFPRGPAKLVERDVFAQSVEMLPVSLKEISITYIDWTDPHNLLPDDQLSNALSELPRRENLTAFSVTGSVGLSILDLSDLSYCRKLSSFRVNFGCNSPELDLTFFRRMAKQGASAARRLPRETTVKLEYDDCYLIYANGRLYCCGDECSKPKWDVEDWKITAFHHEHELTLRLNESPSDDEAPDDHPNGSG